MTSNYTFTKHDPDCYVHGKLFGVDRRDNALTINPHANNYVKTVTEAPLSDWDDVFASAATSILSGVPGVPSVMLHSAYVRSALRGHGRGRDR
jgi:hypothetical protein